MTDRDRGSDRRFEMLRHTARRNEAVMEKCLAQELAMLESDSLDGLINELTAGFKTRFGFDEVSLLLLDADGIIEQLLAESSVAEDARQAVRVFRDRGTLPPATSDLAQPWLGRWSASAHGGYFAGDDYGSAALLPIRRHNTEADRGLLGLASTSLKRFTPEHATDFLERIALVACVCLENALSRERLRLASQTDPLTGLFNRRQLEQRLTEEIHRCVRYRDPLCCLFVDVDHFKQVNDVHGHDGGDKVLVEVAHTLQHLLRRKIDFPVRFGGEEFVVLLPRTALMDAVSLAERMRETLARTVVEMPDGAVRVTVSIGVSELDAAAVDDPVRAAWQLIKRADDAVYAAKRNGRDRVIRAD